MFFAIDSTFCMFYIYIYASKYIFFMYYIKNAPEMLPLPEIFENMRFPLPLPAPALRSRSQQPWAKLWCKGTKFTEICHPNPESNMYLFGM
jgi:hypothetical protein